MMSEVREDIRDLLGWFRKNRHLAAAMFVFACLLSGQKLIYQDIGIDSEVSFRDPEWYNRIWCATGRFGLVFTKKLFGFSYGTVPFAIYFFTLVILWAAVTLFAFLVYRWSLGGLRTGLFYLVFGTMFLSSPILTEQLYFMLQAVEIAWAFFCCVLAAYFSGKLVFEGGRPLYGLFSVLLLIWAFGTYQAFTVIYLIMVLISYLLAYTAAEKQQNWFQAGCTQAFLFLGGLAGWQLIHKFLCRFFFEELSYTSNMILWKVNPSGCVKLIAEEFVKMLTGNTFFYQKLFAPMLILTLVYMTMQALQKKGRQLPCFFLALVLFALAPMSLFLVTGGGSPMRARIFYSLEMAFVCACGFSAPYWRTEGADPKSSFWDRRCKKTLYAVLGLFLVFGVWRQTDRSMTLQETAHLACEGDKNLMNRIVSRMEEEAGANLAEVPVVFVGKLGPDLPEDILRGEVTGHSFFDWDADWYAGGNHRITGFANVMGIALKAAEEDTRRQAVEFAGNMEPWPHRDSVRMMGDTLVVKLSSPEKTGNRWWYSGGWHYWMNDFTYSLKNDWKEIDGSWYYFNEAGHMVTGSQVIDGSSFVFDGDGKWTGN